MKSSSLSKKPKIKFTTLIVRLLRKVSSHPSFWPRTHVQRRTTDVSYNRLAAFVSFTRVFLTDNRQTIETIDYGLLITVFFMQMGNQARLLVERFGTRTVLKNKYWFPFGFATMSILHSGCRQFAGAVTHEFWR